MGPSEQKNNMFLRHVRRDQETGCDVWTGSIGLWGQGRIHQKGRMVSAHREAWRRAHGPIPTGKWILHRCGNQKCVRIEHLYIGSQSDRDAALRERHRAKGDNGQLTLRIAGKLRGDLESLAQGSGKTAAEFARSMIEEAISELQWKEMGL